MSERPVILARSLIDQLFVMFNTLYGVGFQGAVGDQVHIPA